MEWKRVGLEHPFFNDEETKFGFAHKHYYTPVGHTWPLFCISLCDITYMPGNGYGLDMSIKESPDSWWQKSSLPKELVGELVEMLMEKMDE